MKLTIFILAPWEFIIYTIMQISIFFPRKGSIVNHTIEELMQIFFGQKPTLAVALLKIWKNYSFQTIHSRFG